MNYNHQISVQWSSQQARDEVLMQAVKDAVPHLIADLFLEDEAAIGQHTATTIMLVDALPANEDGHVPLGVTAFPIQMEMKKVRQLEVKIRITTLHQMIHTLAHEMEHVRQGYTGELVVGFVDPLTTVNVWQGKAFSTKVIGYQKWPWEVQAEMVAEDFMKIYLDCLSFCLLKK